MKKRFIFLLFLCVFIFGCGLNDDLPSDEPGGDLIPDEELTPLTDEELYQALFDINSKVNIHIKIDSDQLYAIQKDYEKYSAMGSKSPIYRMCDLVITVNDYVYEIEEVGIRMKGNTSRRNFYSSENGIYDLIHFKLSFSETFDGDEYDEKLVWESDEERELRKDRLFAGVEKLDLKWNKCYDATHIREIFAFEMYRNFGIVAPHVTLCSVQIDNLGKRESLGVFTLYECVDKIFIKKNFEYDDGDLYKIGWGLDMNNNHSGGTFLTTTNHSNSIGVEDEDKCYFPIYDLKTNKKKSDHSSLKTLITEVNSDNFDGVDMEYFLKFMALSYLIGNPDDFRTHYNNFYVYFNDSKMVFIPYDYDRCLGITKEWNPSNGMTGLDPNGLYTTELGENVNPIIKEVLSNSNLKELYNNYLIEYANSDFFTFDNFMNYYNAYYKNYNKLVKPSIEAISDKYIKFGTIEHSYPNSTSENYTISKYLIAIKREVKKLK